MLIDTHAHLLDDKFDNDRDNVIANAAAKGITGIIETGWEEAQWNRAVELSKKHEGIYIVLGIHPQEAKNAADSAFALLEEIILREKKAVGIGETGLDLFHKHSTLEQQRSAFFRHIEIAKRTGKPLVIHCRDAYKELLPILDKNCAGMVKPGVIHCFSGTLDEANKLVSMGFLLGIDGPVTYPSAAKLKEVVKNIDLDKLLLETDCPYLTPQSFRGKRNEPAYLTYIAEEIARIKQVSVDTVAEVTTGNARRLFSL